MYWLLVSTGAKASPFVDGGVSANKTAAYQSERRHHYKKWTARDHIFKLLTTT